MRRRRKENDNSRKKLKEKQKKKQILKLLFTKIQKTKAKNTLKRKKRNRINLLQTLLLYLQNYQKKKNL